MPSLPLTMIKQTPHMNWCWAAVTASLRDFYVGSPMQMCDVVGRVSGLSCCGRGSSTCEAMQNDLDGPLRLFNLLRTAPLGVLPFSAGGGAPSVIAEIDARHPVAVGLDFGLFAHFCVITGYDPSGFVTVVDPFFHPDPSVLSYAALLDSYQHGARWVRSYLTGSAA